MAIVKMMTCVNLPPQNDLSLLCSPCIFFITLKKENQIDDILFIRWEIRVETAAATSHPIFSVSFFLFVEKEKNVSIRQFHHFFFSSHNNNLSKTVK